MFSRATSRPASVSARSRSAEAVEGPRVQTILALRTGTTLGSVGHRVRIVSDSQWPLGGGDRGRQRARAGQPPVDLGSAGATLRDGPHDQRLSAAGVAGRGQSLIV